MAESIKVFICYAHQDRELRDELERHLSSLTRSKKITIWHDREIFPGTEWEKEIDAHLDSANLILLLISSYFLASDYCWGREMTHALDRQKENPVGFRVLPVILRPVAWKDTPLGELQVLPTDEKPVTQWTDLHLAFEDITQGITKIVSQLQTVRIFVRTIFEKTTVELTTSPTTTIVQLMVLFFQKYEDDVWPEAMVKAGVERIVGGEKRRFFISDNAMSLHEAGVENGDTLVIYADEVAAG